MYLRGLAGIRATPRLTPASSPGAPGVVDVYVPARDEAEVIEACVQSILSQPEVRRLVVVDDQSTDGTSAILARRTDPRLTVIAGTGPAEGAAGKPSALAHAVTAAPPETARVLFVDADVVLADGAVAALLADADASGADLVTLLPTLTLGSFAERVVMPSVGALIVAAHPPARVADPDAADAFANGQTILLDRVRYAAVGGHAAVISEVLEDVALARRVKADGGHLRVVDGRGWARTRMYASAGEMIEGWTKNLFLLVGARVGAAVTWAALSVLLGGLGVAALAWDRGAFGLGAYLGILAMQADLRRRGGWSAAYAVLAPLGALCVAGLLAASTGRHRSGRGVVWKGRRHR